MGAEEQEGHCYLEGRTQIQISEQQYRLELLICLVYQYLLVSV